MRKLIAILCGTAMMALAGQAVAQMKDDKMMAKDKMMDKMEMKKMDANNDGMVSREEFMKYHETMWGKIKKNDKGMAMMNDVQMAYGPMGTVKP